MAPGNKFFEAYKAIEEPEKKAPAQPPPEPEKTPPKKRIVEI